MCYSMPVGFFFQNYIFKNLNWMQLKFVSGIRLKWTLCHMMWADVGLAVINLNYAQELVINN